MEVCVCLCVFVCDTAQEALLKGMYKAANSSLHTHTHTHTHTRTHRYNLNHKALLCCPVRKGFGCACLCVCVCACPCACVCVCVCVCGGGSECAGTFFSSCFLFSHLLYIFDVVTEEKEENTQQQNEETRLPVCLWL